VVGDADADGAQRCHHVGCHGEELPVHADLVIDNRHDRPEVRQRAKEFVLRRRLADRDCHDANTATALHARKIATDRAKFGFLGAIGISVTEHTLYLTVTAAGAVRIVPVRCANDDGEQNEYHRTKEIGLLQGLEEWVRLYTDKENNCYKVFSAPALRFGEPQFPNLSQAKIFRLAFRDKGRLLDSTEHPLYKKWAP
jgi:hypothetical protein